MYNFLHTGASQQDGSFTRGYCTYILRRDYGSSTVRIQKIYLREDGPSAERIQYLLHRRCSIDFKERMGPPQGGFVFKERTCPSPKRGCVVQGGESFAQNFTTLQRTEGQSGQSPHSREEKKTIQSLVLFANFRSAIFHMSPAAARLEKGTRMPDSCTWLRTERDGKGRVLYMKWGELLRRRKRGRGREREKEREREREC
jgi:hypothetical protein